MHDVVQPDGNTQVVGYIAGSVIAKKILAVLKPEQHASMAVRQTRWPRLSFREVAVTCCNDYLEGRTSFSRISERLLKPGIKRNGSKASISDVQSFNDNKLTDARCICYECFVVGDYRGRQKGATRNKTSEETPQAKFKDGRGHLTCYRCLLRICKGSYTSRV